MMLGSLIGRSMTVFILKSALILAGLLVLTGQAHGVRIKDIADIKGVRQNQLVGYGLVVGLKKWGSL
jgi:flagellar P-ring protein precursor FlgI